MTRRLLTVATGLATGATILTVSGALAAYSSPRLDVTQQDGRVTIAIAQSAGDDATAFARILSPSGTELTPARAPGSVVGDADAVFVATGLGDGQMDAHARITVATEAQIADAARSPCAKDERIASLLIVPLAGNGVVMSVPLYILSGGHLLLCMPHPADANGAKLVSLKLVLDGVLQVPQAATWIALWVPYDGNATPDTSRVVASPAVFGPGSVSFTARARGAGAVLRGSVRQGGAPRGAAKVTITSGATRTAQRRLGVATTNFAGRFTFRAKSGTYFRAIAAVDRASRPDICFALEGFLHPIPCVNPTLNGFSVQSKVVRKR